ncbi:hypothetical protein R6Z07F_012769 [Ovis aries]
MQYQNFKTGTSLVVHWLRLYHPNRGLGLTPAQGTRSCMPQLRPSAAKSIKKKKPKTSKEDKMHVYSLSTLLGTYRIRDHFLSLLGSDWFPGGSEVKNPPANAGDAGDANLISGLGRALGEGNGNSLSCSCLGNPTDRGAWWATVHGVAKSWTQLSMHALMHGI